MYHGYTDVCEHNLLYVCLFVDNNAIILIGSISSSSSSNGSGGGIDGDFNGNSDSSRNNGSSL